MPTDPELPSRGIAAHRGGGANRPENTLAAFRAAAAAGAHQVELDVHPSADGELVVIHDPTLERTTNGAGPVGERTLAELRELDAGAGERIPTLEEVLDVLPRDLWVNVQVKPGEPEWAERAAAAIAGRGRLHQAFLACGNAAARAARAAFPTIRICNLVRQSTRALYIEHCADTGSDFVQFHWLRGRPAPDEVDRAHALGLRVNHFCHPDDERELELLFASGVDFVLVDDVPAGLERAALAGIPPRGLAPGATLGPAAPLLRPEEGPEETEKPR